MTVLELVIQSVRAGRINRETGNPISDETALEVIETMGPRELLEFISEAIEERLEP